LAARLVDIALEATVVASFSRIGPALRSRLEGWRPPAAAAGRLVVVTGATSGIGLAAARLLWDLGAWVCLVGRDAGRLERARQHVEAGSGSSAVLTELADLSDLEQATGLARRLNRRFGAIDVLVHNAGALLPEHRASPQGHEATVALHVLSPFVLTEALLGCLARSRPAAVIAVTSGGMYTQRFRLADLAQGPQPYRGAVAYARAKRAQVVLCREWQRRHSGSGVHFAAVNPGWVDTPGLASGMPTFARVMGPVLRSPDQGADTVVWLAGTPGPIRPGGRLWLDRRPRLDHRLPWTLPGPGGQDRDGRELWDWCWAQAGEFVPAELRSQAGPPAGPAR
jgi:dehydrogenase/reductase SDR family protein 12